MVKGESKLIRITPCIHILVMLFKVLGLNVEVRHHGIYLFEISRAGKNAYFVYNCSDSPQTSSLSRWQGNLVPWN